MRNVILEGRDPNLKVCQDGKVVPFAKAANDLLESLMKTAKVLDDAHGGTDYADAISAQKAKVTNSDLTPSGKIMTLLGQGKNFLDIAREQAEIHKDYFQSLKNNDEFDQTLLDMAKKSIAEQESLEQSDNVSFDEFLESYNKS